MAERKKFVFLKRLVWGLAAGVALSTACTTAVLWPHLPSPGRVAAKVQSDVVYGRADGKDLLMDVYCPSNEVGAKLPVVMYIHGGGWIMGGKSMLAMMPGPAELLRRGYVVVSVDYRLAPHYKFPLMLEDVIAAVHYLRTNAAAYQIDPNRLGVMGDSAGGHLAALLGLTGDSGIFAGEDSSSRVEAVADLYGPTDFINQDQHPSKTTIHLLQKAFGATNANDPILTRASPVTYVTGHAPPFLILHGDHDGLVDIQQSVELNARLKAAGDDSTLVVLTNYAHGYTPLGLKASPDDEARAKLVADFFDRTLR